MDKGSKYKVAAINEDSHDSEQKTVWGINAYAHSGQSRTIHDYRGCYDPLQYPLIFSYGDIGWHHGNDTVLPQSIMEDAARSMTKGKEVIDLTKDEEVIDLTKDEEVIDLTKDEDDVQFFMPSMKQQIEQNTASTELGRKLLQPSKSSVFWGCEENYCSRQN